MPASRSRSQGQGPSSVTPCLLSSFGHDLKARLDGMRDLMAGNELSQQTERALRKELKSERVVLRRRIAMEGGTGPAGADTAGQCRQMPTAPPQCSARTAHVASIQHAHFRCCATAGRPTNCTIANCACASECLPWAKPTIEHFDEEDRPFWREVMRRDRAILRYRRMAQRRRVRTISRRFHNADFNFVLGLNSKPRLAATAARCLRRRGR